MKTVYIIGAGANKEINMPSGYELKSNICDLLNYYFDFGKRVSGDSLILESLELYCRNDREEINQFMRAARMIKSALPQAISIDNYIDAHRDDKYIEIVGKLAIVRSILLAENKSLIKDIEKIDFKLLENTWYTSFFQLLTENCHKNDLLDRMKNLKLITFNYDRCTEYYLYYALKKYYNIDDNELKNLMQSLIVYHPYGAVGSLPFENKNHVNFGSQINSDQLLHLSTQIKTFTESTNIEYSQIKEIRNSVRGAERVIFLGFAYHPQNLDLLFNSHARYIPISKKLKTYFGTTYDISESNKIVIENEITKLNKSDIKIHFINQKCSNLFKEYWRSLSFL
ncbi:MAG TPA: hypothetical protein PLA54_05315 [Spirochaetota bacterium]|nr:hypothetical protein [Spirochaetota bacterium]HQE58599.1 hypothetical protein [Spirochaetota bacterium]